ncbi:MAG: patatin-like phospholipase family protein, partial [Bacteroidaceae bacterium]|nr:patatin-like phospholipase family protein [Bacteroidaceae bacterium]
MTKNGLILEGGGMRALFTAGILDVMMEEGVTFDGMVGVSAGATFGCNFKSRQPGRSLRYNLRFIGDSRYMGWRTLLKDGN